MISDHRLTFGRLSIYIEPRDLWVGVYRDPPRALYFVLVPTVVFKWTRRGVITPGHCSACGGALERGTSGAWWHVGNSCARNNARFIAERT